jgi:hypothetical protein
MDRLRNGNRSRSVAAASTTGRHTPTNSTSSGSESFHLNAEKEIEEAFNLISEREGSAAAASAAGGDGQHHSPPTSLLGKIVHVAGMPFACAFRWTIPNITKPKPFLKFALMMAVVWLGLLTYVLVMLVETVAHCLEIPTDIIGVTVLAARCAFFDRNLHSRSAIGSHAFAPLEARPCV